MQLIHDHLHDVDPALTRIPLTVDRLTLAKRRWRGTANDGAEFGFDLEAPVIDGDVFFTSETSAYYILQTEEMVLEVAIGDDAASAVRLGWMIGNLQFALEIAAGVVRVPDSPSLRQLFDSEQLPYKPAQRVFRPLIGQV